MLDIKKCNGVKKERKNYGFHILNILKWYETR